MIKKTEVKNKLKQKRQENRKKCTQTKNLHSF